MYVTFLALHYLGVIVNGRFYVLLHSCYAIDKSCNIGQEGRQGMVPLEETKEMRVNVRLNEIRDTFEACNRHAMKTIWYIRGDRLPHYPVPAIANPLDVIAAVPCGPVTDFIDIGYYGRHWK